MSKKKRNVIIVVTALLFFGALMFNLKYPLMKETSAKSGKVASVVDKTDVATVDVDKTEVKSEAKDANKTDVVKKEDKKPEKETVEVKLDNEDNQTANNKSDSNSTVSTSNSKSSSTSKTSSSASTGKTSSSKSSSISSSKSTSSGSTSGSKPSSSGTSTTAPAFKIPSTNHFYSASTSTDPDYAEVYISMNIWENYDTQLNELYNVIAPVAGSSVANQIISYARTKTKAHKELQESWDVGGRRLEISSDWGSGIVNFASWR